MARNAISSNNAGNEKFLGLKSRKGGQGVWVRIDKGISERGLVKDLVGSARRLVEGSIERSVKGLLEGLVMGWMIEMKVRGLSELMRTISKGSRPMTKLGSIQDRRVLWQIFGLSGVQGNMCLIIQERLVNVALYIGGEANVKIRF